MLCKNIYWSVICWTILMYTKYLLTLIKILTVMCSTRVERRLIRIWYQKEYVESKLDGQMDSHSDFSAHMWVEQIKYCCC